MCVCDNTVNVTSIQDTSSMELKNCSTLESLVGFSAVFKHGRSPWLPGKRSKHQRTPSGGAINKQGSKTNRFVGLGL